MKKIIILLILSISISLGYAQRALPALDTITSNVEISSHITNYDIKEVNNYIIFKINYKTTHKKNNQKIFVNVGLENNYFYELIHKIEGNFGDTVLVDGKKKEISLYFKSGIENEKFDSLMYFYENNENPFILTFNKKHALRLKVEKYFSLYGGIGLVSTTQLSSNNITLSSFVLGSQKKLNNQLSLYADLSYNIVNLKKEDNQIQNKFYNFSPGFHFFFKKSDGRFYRRAYLNFYGGLGVNFFIMNKNTQTIQLKNELVEKSTSFGASINCGVVYRIGDKLDLSFNLRTQRLFSSYFDNGNDKISYATQIMLHYILTTRKNPAYRK